MRGFRDAWPLVWNGGVSQSQILVAVQRSRGVGLCSPDSPNLGKGRDRAPPQPPLCGVHISMYREGVAADSPFTRLEGSGDEAPQGRPGFFLLPRASTLVTKFQSLAALLLRKLPSSSRTQSSCPLGRVLTLSSGGLPLPKDPQSPEGHSLFWSRARAAIAPALYPPPPGP